MKFFLLLTIFICCCLIGFFIKSYFVKRKLFYENLYLFCENLNTNISFNNEKLEFIIKNNIENFSKDFSKFLYWFYKYLKNENSKIEFENNINNFFNYLSAEEKRNFLTFFFLLGSQTTEEELTKIKNFKIVINSIKEETIAKDKKYSGLYFKLFISLGILIFIIFI